MPSASPRVLPRTFCRSRSDQAGRDGWPDEPGDVLPSQQTAELLTYNRTATVRERMIYSQSRERWVTPAAMAEVKDVATVFGRALPSSTGAGDLTPLLLLHSSSRPRLYRQRIRTDGPTSGNETRATSSPPSSPAPAFRLTVPLGSRRSKLRNSRPSACSVDSRSS